MGRESLRADLRALAESAREFDEKGVHGAVWNYLPYREILDLLDENERLRGYVAAVASGMPREQLLEIEREFNG